MNDDLNPSSAGHEGLASSRRRFLGGLGCSAASLVTLGGATAAQAAAWPPQPVDPSGRLDDILELRVEAARQARSTPMPAQSPNGDESRHPRRIACFTKGLPHDEHGYVEPAAYDALVKAAASGRPHDFGLIPVASIHMPLANPQGGLGRMMAGLDSCQFAMPPAPEFAGAERAAEAAELYWMSLVRDVPFDEYDGHPVIQAACRELSAMPSYTGPRADGKVTPGVVFRGSTAGDVVGPYISQFLVQPVRLGAVPISQEIATWLPVASGGNDYITDIDDWLSVQNGDMPMGEFRKDPVARRIRSARDLCAYVRNDFGYQAFYLASVWLANREAPLARGGPYPRNRSNQGAFATFGVPDAQAMLAMAHICALRAVWYQKWIVHRTLRPEEFGGRLHYALKHLADDPVHPLLRDSEALARNFERTRGYLLPQAYPEGAPMHPSYAQGHGCCAGACATVLKAYFEGSTRIMEIADVMQPGADGRALKPWHGVQAGQLTVAGELDKLAGNISMGRNFAGIHWRSDYLQGLLLGEAVALALLREARPSYNETGARVTLRRFDGSQVQV